MINKKMVGKWTVKEYTIKSGTVSDFSNETRTFEFFKYKNAYTRTMKGIYRVDYINSTKLPIIDTFEYQLKNNLIEITKVQNKKVNGSYPNTTGFLKRRFNIDGYKTNDMTFTRNDSTDLNIKVTK